MPKRKPRNDFDALVFNRKEEDADVHANHVRKKDKRTKGIEVVFDPAKHKDFITGFRKRKQQRRKEAQEQLKEKERQQRIANRAEKRSKLKEELGLGDNWGDSSDDDQERHEDSLQEHAGASGPGDELDKDGQVVVYQQQGLMTTVTTMPIEDNIQGAQSWEQNGSDEDDRRDGAAKPHRHKGHGLKQGSEGVQKKQHRQRSSKKGNMTGQGKKHGGRGGKAKGARNNNR